MLTPVQGMTEDLLLKILSGREISPSHVECQIINGVRLWSSIWTRRLCRPGANQVLNRLFLTGNCAAAPGPLR